MSILNSVMNVFKLTGEDDYDEYDDYDEEFEDDEDDKGSARKKLFSGSHKNKDDEDYDSDSRTNDKKPLGRKVVPLKTGGSRGLEVVVIRPESMEDSSEITDTLLSSSLTVSPLAYSTSISRQEFTLISSMPLPKTYLVSRPNSAISV